MKFDIPFSESEYDGMVKQLVNDNTIHPMKIYMQKVNSLGSINAGLTGFDPKFLFNEDNLIKEQITNSLESEVKDLEYNAQLSEEDLRIKKDVIKLIGYDPFSGYSNFDQKFLYNELMPYLTEDTLVELLRLVNENIEVIEKEIGDEVCGK
jgi:hypothetical protein